jgi:hypothetical protein
MKKEITRRKKDVSICSLIILCFYCADVGVIVAAHDNFLGITVSGVGIS